MNKIINRKTRSAFKDGHFYSPIVDFGYVREHADKLWPETPLINGVNFNESGQLVFLSECIHKYSCDFDYPEESDIPGSYYYKNGQFNRWDAIILFSMIRSKKPARIIEIGSGFSSALMADVNKKYFSGSIDIRCIEPYPRDFLKAGIDGIAQVYEDKVQDVDISVYNQLESGDILFIDSSHVSKTGSDVNHIYFNILPLLARGVYIHVHDIFFPEDYKKEWVIQEGRSWNEQYILQALLMYSCGFEVVFGANFALHAWPDLLQKAQKRSPVGGGSFWIKKTA